MNYNQYNFNNAPGPMRWFGPDPMPYAHRIVCSICGGPENSPVHVQQFYPHYYDMKRGMGSNSDVGVAAKKTFWATGLLAAMQDPKCIIKEDDRVVVITDKYPKAEYHFLVLPKEDISNINQLNREHISLLEHMEAVGNEIANEHSNHKFRFGYHALASMFRLHLHVISDDFNSITLKNKKHWNSFTTPFFIASQDLIENIKKDGKVKEISRSDAKEFMDTPLKCHKCSVMPSTMPQLKQHLLVHRLKEKHASQR